MFSKILIANRGEIACRVIDTCRRLGVATVAVHSDVDRDARHVAMADEAVSLGGAAPAESYLRGDAIVDAARATGAEAIHPGYGFLSENPDFVEAVEAAGLAFVGPSAEAIRAMGLKDAAKAAMEAAGVPVVPGYRGDDQSDATLARAAEDVGYPVLVKAVAGGGGKGMRLVERAADFAEALASARAEARAAFGNDRVLIERFVASPRHVEVQVFGDGTRAVHLFERDCSLQRRHQKVIEEAPAPGMTEEVRAAMGAAAVRAAEAIGYAGAGTVEFIADGGRGLRPDGFWFMEMNTRLQVEHPVTEAITGVDLVEWQLRVASGEPLWMAQEDLSIRGHAFEARLYAEDAANGFLPATGRLTHLAFPPGARAETGVRAGDAIGPHYDPMIAKIVTHGPTRGAALGALQSALAGTEVAGTVTNLAFLRRLAGHEGFAAGEVDTGLIARAGDALTAAPVAPPEVRAMAAVAALDPGGPFEGFHLWTPLAREVRMIHRGEEIAARVTVRGPGRYEVAQGAATQEIARDGDLWRVDGRARRAGLHREPGRITLFAGDAHVFELPDPLDRGGASGTAGAIEAPMPGLVKAVLVAPGDPVAEGDRLAVMEAMKMEHTLRAPRDGVVAEVLAAPGAQVEAGAALIRLEEDGA